MSYEKMKFRTSFFTPPFTFSAKLVIFLPATLIKKERPFSLEVFRHTGHSGHLLFAA